MDCRECGDSVAAGDRFCEACGADQDPPLIVVGGDTPSTSTTCTACGTGTVDTDGYCDLCGRLRPAPRDHAELEAGGAAGVSDRGRRHRQNEDALALSSFTALARPTCPDRPPGAGPVTAALVCDGVSTTRGAADASVAAARTAITVLSREMRAGGGAGDATLSAAAAAAGAVARLPRADVEHPSCTYLSVIVEAKAVTIGWLGDCRAYWLGADRTRLTEDDSWAEQAIAAGTHTEAEAYADERAHMIAAWLGADAGDVEPHLRTFTPPGPGTVVVCSDGLWNHLPGAADLAAAVPDAPPLAAARALVDLALERGGHDNITVALLPFAPVPAPTSAPEEHGTGEHATDE